MPGKIGDQTIALDPAQQTAFSKAVKKAQSLIKKKEGQVAAQAEGASKYRRGIILLNHIPFGFFENEMRDYFSQFGHVLRIRLARSQKTGKSKGYAFIEFEFEEVAKIAAECMNGYLMFERLLKCEVVSADVNPKKIFNKRYMREDNFPKLRTRKRAKAAQQEVKSEDEVQEILHSRLRKLEEQNKKLAEAGIEYKFETGIVPMPRKKVEPTASPKSPGSAKMEKKSKKQAMPKLSPKVLGKKLKTPEKVAVLSPKIKSAKRSSLSNAETIKLNSKLPVTTKVVSPKVTPSQKLQDKKRKSQSTPLNVESPLKSPAKSSPSPKKDKKRKSLLPIPEIDEIPQKKQKTPEKAKTPVKSPKTSKKAVENTPKAKKSLETPKQKTPEKAKTPVPSPKASKKAVESTPKAKKSLGSPKQKTPEKPKTPVQSPKVSKQALESTPKPKKSLGKQKTPEPAKDSPKLNKNKKNTTEINSESVEEEVVQSAKKSPFKPKFSPKLLRSRNKSGMPATQPPKEKTPEMKKTKFSPKMLRSRQSDVSGLTPKASSPKNKKSVGRKSVR